MDSIFNAFMPTYLSSKSPAEIKIDQLRERINRGDIDAMRELGAHYFSKEDFQSAFICYEKAYNAGDENAAFALGNICQAWHYRMATVSPGAVLTNVLYKRTIAYYSAVKTGEAAQTIHLRCLYFKAQNGDSDAYFELGKYYLIQFNLTGKMNEKTESFLRKAAFSHHSEASFLLSNLYELGTFTAPNAKEASAFNKRAINHEHPKAILEEQIYKGINTDQAVSLYHFYSKGDESTLLPANKNRAERILLAAAKWKNPRALRLIIELSKTGKLVIDKSILDEYERTLPVAMQWESHLEKKRFHQANQEKNKVKTFLGHDYL